MRDWHERYGGDGLTIVGVHTPEFFWEKPYGKLVEATTRLSIAYAVVQDNDAVAWTRWGIHAWPTTILVDRVGVVRYAHIGEGAYAETEARLRALLAERE